MALATTLGLAAALFAAAAPDDPSFARPVSRDRVARIGTGLMIGGGVLMTTGAGILVPVALSRAMKTRPPQPANYTDVPTFQRDLVDYQLSLHRTMMLAVAGASTGIVGALVFSGGAITFGVARHRARRVRPRVTLSFVPDRRRPQATLTLRF
jgi:hypothetical protein